MDLLKNKSVHFGICPENHFEFTSPCSIAVLKALIPSLIVLASLASSLPVPRAVKRLLHPVTDIFQDRTSLENIAPAHLKESLEQSSHVGPTIARQSIFVGVGLIGSLFWSACLGLRVVGMTWNNTPRYEAVWQVWTTSFILVSWLYLLCLPLLIPSRKPRYSALCIYMAHATLATVSLASTFYLKTVNGGFPARAKDPIFLTQEIISLLLAWLGIGATMGLSVTDEFILAGSPDVQIDDNVNLHQWITFSWVWPLIRTGYDHDLADNEVPPLSRTMRTKESYETLKSYKSASLLIRILRANSLDTFLDISLTFISVICNYASPYLIKRILDAVTDPTPEAKARAYVYAILALLASIGKAQADIFHLWHGRRCSVRVRNQLVALIYDKALRRKDTSGVIDKETTQTPVTSKDKKKQKTTPAQPKQAADSGRVVSLMASDSARISNVISGLYFVVSGCLELPVAAVFLYSLLGYSAFVGLIVMVIASPLTSLFMKRYIAIQQLANKARDKRITIMNELIAACKIIKFSGETENWKEKALAARRAEMKLWVKNLINGLMFHMVYILGPLAVTLVSFSWYIFVAKGKLTVATAFTSLSLFSMIRQPLNTIPQFGVMISQAYVSLQRIASFLEEDEVPDWVSSLKRPPPTTSGKIETSPIGFRNASFKFNTGISASQKTAKDANDAVVGSEAGETPVEEDSLPFELVDLDFEIPANKFTVISGPVGSGKTALLLGLLGEMDCVKGQVLLPKEPTQIDPRSGLRNSVAYCSQTPWLRHQSIRENILFGEDFDETRYQTTLEACALLPDLDVLEDGDSTEVGVRGVSLSGGQKARIALARAVYSYNAHVLLDDVLAAVDSHTARHLVDRCLNGPILAGRTVLMVSHHVELLLPISAYLIRMLAGRVDNHGTPASLREKGLLDGFIATESMIAHRTEESNEMETEKLAHDDTANTKARPGRKLVQDEERTTGSVPFQTYKTYIVRSTWTVWIITIVLLGCSQLATNGERIWLKLWGSAYSVQGTTMGFIGTRSESLATDLHSAAAQQHFVAYRHQPASRAQHAWLSLPSADLHPGYYLFGLALIDLASFAISILSTLNTSWGSYKAAISIHNSMLDRVMGADIRFFDTTPSGRIINRFSKDVETIDNSLSSTLKTVLGNVALLIGSIAMVASILPGFLLPASFIGYAFYMLTTRYLATSRSLRRIEATKRSPIFSGFSEVLDGLTIVRAFGAESLLMRKIFHEQDESQAAFYHLWMCNRWLLYRFDALGAAAVFLTTVLALSGAVDAGYSGVAILSSQSLVMGVYWLSRFWGSLEQDFNSVERAQEYLVLPQEPPSIIEGHRPPAYWPSVSNKESPFLQVNNLTIRYAPDLPAVLQDLTFSIKAKEKIGVVGRTGSGKSTLAMSLLRFVDPDPSGSIVLDGIDCTSIGVDDLRSRISYIPQEAFLFTGTVRENLDPFQRHSDDELLEVMEKVQLGGAVGRTPSDSRAASRVPSLANLQESDAAVKSVGSRGRITLDTQISQGGSSVSAGQRQLIALARALLRRSNLVLADECSASLDTQTDEAIQACMREVFEDTTTITIAHRLSTVIDVDRLIVLADGKLAEIGSPWELLNKIDGKEAVFKSMAVSSGHFSDLFESARVADQKKEEKRKEEEGGKKNENNNNNNGSV